MFVTGPDVIKTVTHEDVTMARLGGAATHNEISGVAHFMAANDEQVLATIRELLTFLPSNNLDAPPRARTTDDPARADAALDTLIPEASNQPYDMIDVITKIVDDGYLFQVHEHFAKNIVVGFARMAGRPVGIVANQPAFLAGVLDIDASVKAARFVRFCDCFNIPLITFEDVPGFMPGVAAGARRHHPPRRQAALRLRRGDRAQADRHHAQGLRRRVLRDEFASTCAPTSTSPGRPPRSPSWDPRARSTSSTSASSSRRSRPPQAVWPQGKAFTEEEKTSDPRRPPRGEGRGVPRALRQPLRRGRARLHRRGHPPQRNPPPAEPGARHAGHQAREEPTEEARQHPAVKREYKIVPRINYGHPFRNGSIAGRRI